MSSKYTLRFAPDSLGDFKDFMMVQTESQHLFVVPIEARRPPPVLTPRVLDCGYCLVGGVKFLEFMCQNVGLSAGTFYIIPKDQWPAPNLRFSEKPPFAVGPCVFSLQPGEAIVVVFFPTTVEHCSQPFAIICDNCQVKYISLEESQLVGVELVSISGENEPLTAGEMHDLTAEHFVRFSECHPHIEQQKRLVIRNNHLELAFHWQIMKPNLRSLLPGETHEPSHIQFHPDTNDVYHMSPPSGLLAPCQEHEFLLTFCPKELKDYHSVFHLVLRDINVIIMDIEVKGSTELYRVLLEPYGVIIPGEIFISIATHRQFKMWNHSKTFILFQWERLNSSSHVIDVEPSAGRIEENECFDFEVIVTGGKPDKLKTNLVCNIQHRHEPVKLPIEISFKGPTVKLSVPCVDFGLVRLGDEVQTTLSLTNTTPLEACWMFKEKINNKQHSPFWIQAVVQSPQVCFLNCKLVFSDLYLGVPSTGTVTLFNQTLLPSHFSWLQGKQASLCTATFDPSSGILGPNATMNINVNLTSHTDFVTGLLAHGNGAAFMVQPDSGQLGPFETKTVDVTAYCLMWGEYRDHLICKQVGDLEPMHITMRMTVKGCPLYFQMIGPQPDDQCQGPTMFGTHLSGGDTISQPLRINNPTMFDIQVDWEIYNIDENDHTLIELVMPCGDHFPLKDDDGNELLKGGKEKEYEEEEHLYPAKKNFISVHTRPYIGSLSDSPYSIIPQQIVIPAKSTGCIHVSFTPFNLSESQCESRCVGVACGFLNLNSEKAVCIPGKVRRDLALDLQPVKLDLLGTIKPALLVQLEDDSETLEFNASAGDLLRVESDNEVVVSEFSIVESFQLRNIKETPLHFKLETQPPFSVVKVAFHCSLSLLDLLNHTEEDLSLAGSLIHTKTGRKKLRLQQNLLIHHSNNNLQSSSQFLQISFTP
uniref:DLEC1 cilia and flagella associated protein n=1 Tax=Xiphophorus couchianus TaxID=32473 RepID=A0A3B5LVK0_9TELE